MPPTETISSKDQTFIVFDYFLYQQCEDYADAIDAELTALRYRLYGVEGMERVR